MTPTNYDTHEHACLDEENNAGDPGPCSFVTASAYVGDWRLLASDGPKRFNLF